MIRNRATPDGRELGRQLARLCDEAEPRARLKVPELTPRCASCAFREGPHLASGSSETLMDALKCVMEGVEFGCHDVHRPDHLCSGWLMLTLADPAKLGRLKVPWSFTGVSDPPARPAPAETEGRGR